MLSSCPGRSSAQQSHPAEKHRPLQNSKYVKKKLGLGRAEPQCSAEIMIMIIYTYIYIKNVNNNYNII